MLTGAKTWYPALDERCGTYCLQKAEMKAREKYLNEMLRIERLRELQDRGLRGTNVPMLRASTSMSRKAVDQPMTFQRAGVTPSLGNGTLRPSEAGLSFPPSFSSSQTPTMGAQSGQQRPGSIKSIPAGQNQQTSQRNLPKANQPIQNRQSMEHERPNQNNQAIGNQKNQNNQAMGNQKNQTNEAMGNQKNQNSPAMDNHKNQNNQAMENQKNQIQKPLGNEHHNKQSTGKQQHLKQQPLNHQQHQSSPPMEEQRNQNPKLMGSQQIQNQRPADNQQSQKNQVADRRSQNQPPIASQPNKTEKMTGNQNAHSQKAVPNHQSKGNPSNQKNQGMSQQKHQQQQTVAREQTQKQHFTSEKKNQDYRLVDNQSHHDENLSSQPSQTLAKSSNIRKSEFTSSERNGQSLKQPNSAPKGIYTSSNQQLLSERRASQGTPNLNPDFRNEDEIEYTARMNPHRDFNSQSRTSCGDNSDFKLQNFEDSHRRPPNVEFYSHNYGNGHCNCLPSKLGMRTEIQAEPSSPYPEVSRPSPSPFPGSRGHGRANSIYSLNADSYLNSDGRDPMSFQGTRSPFAASDYYDDYLLYLESLEYELGKARMREQSLPASLNRRYSSLYF